MTWEDIKLIRDIMDEVWDDYLMNGFNGKEWTDEEYYGEILLRFNERKNK